LNPEARIITRQLSEDSSKKLLRSGASSVIRQDRIGALRMVSEMLRPTAVGFLDWMIKDKNSSYRFGDINIPASAGVTVGQLEGDGKLPALIVALCRAGGETYEINPSAETELAEGDTLVALGTSPETAALQNRVDRLCFPDAESEPDQPQQQAAQPDEELF
ncbi:MAG: TrkA C-terminal domain-containing protein, partial [Elusimicrobiaceae bacterium]|nr:TrkA C-terminal domain-containing protein [Elusimicrobiaceae bacterium]